MARQRQATRNDQTGVDRGVRERIVGVARRQFLANGFRGVTMDDLAEQLGMSKTLYAHFTSKTALIEAMLVAKFQEAELELAAVAVESRSDFAAGLRGLLACLHRHLAEIQPPFVRDLGREAPEVFQVVEHRRRELIERHFGRLLTEGRREGFVRKDISIPLMIDILLGAVQSVMTPPKITELGLTPQTVLTAILTVFLEGVIKPGGRTGV